MQTKNNKSELFKSHAENGWIGSKEMTVLNTNPPSSKFWDYRTGMSLISYFWE